MLRGRCISYIVRARISSVVFLLQILIAWMIRWRKLFQSGGINTWENLDASSIGQRGWAWATWVRNMGGGPRTYPGGVSKWQWKRMLVKQREERERIRLAREKEFFAMRQRAEILASHPELQQPWEKLATFPTRDVSPSQQIAGLVRRFHRPHHAEDLWTERDGPQKGTESLSVSGTMESDHNKSRDPSVLSNSSSDAEGEDDLSIYERNQLSSSMRSPVHLHTAGSLTVKRKKNETSIEKNMQDYLDSFGTDPLGVVVKTGTQQSKKEVRKDPLGLSMTCKAAEKKKVGKGGRKNRGR